MNRGYLSVIAHGVKNNSTLVLARILRNKPGDYVTAYLKSASNIMNYGDK